MQFERIPNGRSQRFLTDVHTHKLTATLPVYPSKKDTSALKQCHFFLSVTTGTRDVFVSNAKLQVGDPTVILENGSRCIMFLYAIHTIETHRDYTN